MDKPVRANVFMLCFMIYCALLPFVFALVSLSGLVDAESESFESAIMLFQHILLFLVPILICCAVTKTRLGSIIPHEPLALRDVLLSVLIALFTLPLMLWVGFVTDFFVQDTSGIENEIAKYPMGFLIFSIGVMPGVFEELMFRGVIMTGYKRTGLVRSVVFSALLFGIMHLNLYQLAYTAAAGIVFGIMVQYTNSIYSSMLAHFTINSVQVVLSKLSDPDAAAAEEYTKMEMLASGSVMLACTLPVLIGLMYILIRCNRGRNIDYRYSLSARREFVSDIDAGRGRIIDFPFVLVIIIYVLYLKMMDSIGAM